MVSALVEFAILAAVIVLAGVLLTRCADAFAEITRVGRLLVGSILLAGATSLPELTVGLSAIRLNLPDLAVGDLLGASLMNLLNLAIMDLCFHSRSKMLSRAAAAHALSGVLSIALTALIGLGILTSSLSTRLTLGGAHMIIWMVAIGYLLGVRLVFLDQRIAVRQMAEQTEAAEPPAPRRPLSHYLLGFLAGAAIIFFVGPRLAEAAERLATLSGLGQSFVGTTFVAVCTAMPELVTSITAMRMGAHDLVIGNVFGSNAFNMLLFLPLELAHPGSLFTAAHGAHVITAFAVILCTSLVIMGQLYQQESRVRFLDPDAWIIIAIIAGALSLVYASP